ncbi:helix-hairpin-helix domain-containing protein [Galbibacter sp. BG1]|uniref:ComEA family DNA-binding protein n=1 Tax=Galbibacter sp. BG1 TaxID=1170699 RepID=UPI0015B819F8|nr:helix-hairpin-helix domain-containing protein [Galbibacter sp. BG1]QLE01677.1 helix-hairpin-helix domain-containing protein [Galbibacter sp. BG1]
MKLISHFRFSKSQRSGILFLATLIIGVGFLAIGFSSFINPKKNVAKPITSEEDKLPPFKIYPFNPNYISDFKGYSIGLSPEAIDRLTEYRNTGRFINSSKEFQKVTKISDSLLREIAPHFKFPTFEVVSKKVPTEKAIVKIDINKATPADFKSVYGVGDKLSERIVKYRELLGGYYYLDQLEEVYGLSSETIANIKNGFAIKTLPVYHKINVNTASVKEISEVPYLNWSIAKKIVTYRTKQRNVNSISELTKIEDFPANKLNRIELYLTTD